MKSPPSRLQRFSTTDIRLGVAITVAIIGIWFMGDFHSMHDSDSVIHSLNSLYRWTVFVWEYDHVGQLLSLLTRRLLCSRAFTRRRIRAVSPPLPRGCRGSTRPRSSRRVAVHFGA